MKAYTITVNGVEYDVTVEEKTGAAAKKAAAAAAAPAPAPARRPAAPARDIAPAAPVQAAGGEGSVVIESPMPGKILAIKAQPGTAVTAGQVILVLEAMKMENEIVAPQAGTVASVNVAVGEMVEPGAKLATMN